MRERKPENQGLPISSSLPMATMITVSLEDMKMIREALIRSQWAWGKNNHACPICRNTIRHTEACEMCRAIGVLDRVIAKPETSKGADADV